MKILIFLALLFSGVNISYAYDFEQSFDLSGMGNIVNSSPVNFYDITITQESEVSMYYVSNSCDYNGSYYLEILGVGQIECVQNNDYGLNTGTFTLGVGTYELEINNNSNEYYYLVSDIFVGGYYTSNSGSGNGGGSTSTGSSVNFEGDFFDISYKQVGFFQDYDEFIEFAEETTIMYVVGLLLLTLGMFGRAVYSSIE